MKCKRCSKRSYSEYCFRCKPRKDLKRTPVKKVGKRTKQWLYERSKWIKDNPADHAGYWYCHYCNKALDIHSLTLDHMHGRDGSLLTDRRYIVPCCSEDNSLKGSMSYETFCAQFYPHLLKIK